MQETRTIMLVSTKPDTKGKEAVLFRSRQLTEFKWAPLCDIPTFTKTEGNIKFCAGQEQKGVIYSSTEPTDKFIGENVSFETFLSALANPDSALYHKNLGGHCNSWPFFGVVCNGLVRYSLNIQRRFSTRRWASVPGMRKIAPETTYTAEEIQLCDVLHAYGNGANHVALITDILRDEDGQIRQIEVSEATRPTCVRRQFDVDVFFEKYKVYALWRYDYVDEVPMPDTYQNALLEQGVPALPVIAVDYGNKSNYRPCEEVVISVFADGENEIEIRRGDEVIEKAVFNGRAKLIRKFERGYYTVKHVGTGELAEFCVTDPQISFTVQDGILSVKTDPCDPESWISHMEFRGGYKSTEPNGYCPDTENLIPYYCANSSSLSKLEELTDEEKQTGVFARPIPADGRSFKITYENKYGKWTHTLIKLWPVQA